MNLISKSIWPSQLPLRVVQVRKQSAEIIPPTHKKIIPNAEQEITKIFINEIKRTEPWNGKEFLKHQFYAPTSAESYGELKKDYSYLETLYNESLKLLNKTYPDKQFELKNMDLIDRSLRDGKGANPKLHEDPDFTVSISVQKHKSYRMAPYCCRKRIPKRHHVGTIFFDGNKRYQSKSGELIFHEKIIHRSPFHQDEICKQGYFIAFQFKESCSEKI